MRTILIKSSVLFILVFNVSFSFGQDIKVADSLSNIFHYSDQKTDNDRLNLAYQIAKNHTNYDSVLLYSRILIDLATKLHDDTLKLKGYYYCGLAYISTGNYHRALEAYLRSAKVAESISNNTYLIAIFTALGDVYSNALNSNSAILYYNKAIDLSLREKDSISLAIAYLNAGCQYFEIEMLDSSLTYLQKSNIISTKIDYPIGIAYSLAEIGNLLIIDEKYSLAEEKITKAIEILEEYKDSYALAIYYGYLSKVYKSREDFKPALEFAQISLLIAQQANLLPQVRDAYQLLTQLHAINGNLDTAFKYQSLYIATRDSINNEEVIRKMADLRTEYEVAQKQAEVDILNKQRQNQRVILISLFAVFLITCGFFLVHYNNTRKRKLLNKSLIRRKQELQKQKDKLEKLNKTKDRFFSIISHDLRGPINVLNGTTLLIRDFLDSKNYDELDELTSNMEYSVKKVQNLLDNLLEWAVSQQGNFPYKPEQLDMEAICDEVLNIFIIMAATKSIAITFEVKPDAKYVYADRNSLLTILRNLISNALKFTHKDGAVNILAEVKQNEYCLTVSDTGIGIPPEKLETLFVIDENKSTWGTKREKGLGIGLSLVNEFIKMNKGKIFVDSTVGAGSSFSIYLPLEDLTTSSEVKPLSKKKPSKKA